MSNTGEVKVIEKTEQKMKELEFTDLIDMFIKAQDVAQSSRETYRRDEKVHGLAGKYR